MGYYYDLEESVRIVKRGTNRKEFPHPGLRARGRGASPNVYTYALNSSLVVFTFNFPQLPKLFSLLS